MDRLWLCCFMHTSPRYINSMNNQRRATIVHTKQLLGVNSVTSVGHIAHTHNMLGYRVVITYCMINAFI